MEKETKCKVVGIACGFLAISLIFMAVQSFFRSYAEARAYTQVTLFYEIQEQAHDLNTPIDLAKGLKNVVLLSPCTTNDAHETRLTHIVEMVRSNVASELVCRLKEMTGQDFGSNTVTSIDKFLLNATPTNADRKVPEK